MRKTENPVEIAARKAAFNDIKTSEQHVYESPLSKFFQAFTNVKKHSDRIMKIGTTYEQQKVHCVRLGI